MSTILRQAAIAARQSSRVRTFSSCAVARKDLVQDIYLRELRAYKPTPVAKDAHVGVVKQFTLPPSPQAPAIPADLATELTSYDGTEPTVASVTPTTTGANADQNNGSADEFLNFLESDLPKVEHGHH